MAGIAGFALLKPVLGYLSALSRVVVYLNGTYETSGISLLSVYFLCRVALLLSIIFFCWARISDEDRFIVFCSAVGVTIQVVLSSNDALALRGSEVFGVFDLLAFLIPLKVLHNRGKLAYGLGLLVLGAVFFYSSFKVINPYRSVLASSHSEHLPTMCISISAFSEEVRGIA
jgi:hypothetical protein